GGIAGGADLFPVPVGERCDQLHDVVELQLGHVDEREVADRAVGPVEHEQVRELGYRDRQVGRGSLGPHRVEGDPTSPHDLDGAHEAVDPEAGGEHQHVELVQAAVDGAYTLALDTFDAVGDEVGVGPLDGGIEVR